MARRHRMNVAPPAPKAPKPQRPQGKILRDIYKGLMTLSASNRINALAQALQWYDKAQLYMLSKNKGQALAPDIIKALEIAVKARKIGISATMEGEKEQGFRTAIFKYEKACAMVKPPSLDESYKKFESQKQKLEQRQLAATQKFGSTLQELAKAAGGEIRLLVFDSPKVRQLVPQQKEIVYNREGAKQIVETVRRQGILSAFVAELDTMARCLAFETDGSGGYQINADLYIAAQARLLKNFVKFAGTADAPSRVVKFGATAEHGAIPVPVSSTPKAPRVGAPQRTPRVGGRVAGPKVAGRYAPDSTMAILYLKLKDGAEHKVTDILVGVPAADPKSRLVNLGKDVVKFGWGTFVWKGDTVKMSLTPAQAGV